MGAPTSPTVAAHSYPRADGIDTEHSPRRRPSTLVTGYQDIANTFHTAWSDDASPGKARRISTGGQESPEHAGDDDDEEGRKRRRMVPSLTSCEACRRGKRRCEPSPLVPPDHRDVGKLPCARCRRFALDCVRITAARRKGPAPVDLSAISDRQHGFQAPTGLGLDTGTALAPIMATEPETLSPRSGRMSASPASLDQMLPLPFVDKMIGLFFDYVYPLTPCLHRPSFLADLAAQRDRRDPVFFALALAVVGSTLVQVPHMLVGKTKAEVEAVARRCVHVEREKVAFLWAESVPMRAEFVVICYLEGIVHLLLGNNTAHVMATAQANQCALAMRLNEESSYDGLDPIECEVRRRIYWLLYQADKSTACLRSRTMLLRAADAPELVFPSAIDDEHITALGYLPQPADRPSVLSGFNVVATLFQILEAALDLQRRRGPRDAQAICDGLREVERLRVWCWQCTEAAPAALRIQTSYNSKVNSPGLDWNDKFHQGVKDFFAGPAEQVNSFLVMQGNILVTQQVVRLVLLETHEALTQQLAGLELVPAETLGVGAAGGGADDMAEDIACVLLDGLKSMPIECVAINGPSLVQKVRFIAIRLMEGSTSPTPQAIRAQNLLLQFLSVLAVIEGMYSFGKEVSAE
ncbi:hypothetical protein Q5752_001544 [Cryptotrichosporon argae]